MAVMKQIEICLERFFTGQPPLKKKWFATQRPNQNEPYNLYLFHYHHLVLVYNFREDTILYEWWEREADKRGLDSSKEWLSQNKSLTKTFSPE